MSEHKEMGHHRTCAKNHDAQQRIITGRLQKQKQQRDDYNINEKAKKLAIPDFFLHAVIPEMNGANQKEDQDETDIEHLNG